MTNTQKFQDRIEALYQAQMLRLHSETDRMFLLLMLFQWIGGIVLAMGISPYTWIGQTAYLHLHIWAATVLGGLITSLPMLLVLRCPGSPLTRHVIAIAQILWSALLIHLSGGRIETHFHVFGSLAFLAFYRDWKVLVTATLVVAVDHFFRGIYWPLSVFGEMTASPFRWLEHAAWVVFENVILVIACFRGLRETRELCRRQAQLEATNEKIEMQVRDRTQRLQRTSQKLAEEICERQQAKVRESRLGRIIDRCINEIYVFDRDSLQLLEVNRCAVDNLGFSKEELLTMTPLNFRPTHDDKSFVKLFQPLIDNSLDVVTFECYHRRKNGSLYPVEVHMQLADWANTSAIVAVILDITGRRQVEFERDRIQEKLVHASHRAGMAEVATGVLHNVGNVLNSVNVSANLIQERLTRSRIGGLQRAVELLDANQNDLPNFIAGAKGQKLPAYLRQLSGSLTAERDELMSELNSLNDNIEHIKEVVQTQQSFARIGGAVESLNPVDVLEAAIRIRSSSCKRHHVDIVRDFDENLMVVANRHKLMQVLINLVSNATNAIKESYGKVRRMTVSVKRKDADMIEIRVQDTGVGIASQNLCKIFSHGFTTRNEGHGFGLHSSALAAKELGGSLHALSDGPGQGAIFVMTLPVAPKQRETESPACLPQANGSVPAHHSATTCN